MLQEAATYPTPGLLPASLITSFPFPIQGLSLGIPSPYLCALGRAAQLFPGWWFGPGRAVPTALTPAQRLSRFGLHRELPSRSSPVQRSWGAANTAPPGPAQAPSPSARAHPLLPWAGRAGGLSIETFPWPLGQWGLGQVLGAAPSLVACWGFRHLGLVTRQPRREGWLWLRLAQPLLLRGRRTARPGSRSGGLLPLGGVGVGPQLCNLRTPVIVSA